MRVNQNSKTVSQTAEQAQACCEAPYRQEEEQVQMIHFCKFITSSDPFYIK